MATTKRCAEQGAYNRRCWSGAHTLDANAANHFFVEMADQTTAEAICAEQPGDFYFNSLVRLPSLIGIFDAIAPPDTISRLRYMTNYACVR